MYTDAMPPITTFLTFNDRAEEAANLYVSVFPKSRIGKVARYGAAMPDLAGKVMTVEFELDGKPFVALNGGPQFQFSEGVSLMVTCETQAEIDHYWSKLGEGGQPMACGWLKDRFGLAWQITPAMLMPLITSPDPTVSKRAMEVMMTMVKFDIAALRRGCGLD